MHRTRLTHTTARWLELEAVGLHQRLAERAQELYNAGDPRWEHAFELTMRALERRTRRMRLVSRLGSN